MQQCPFPRLRATALFFTPVALIGARVAHYIWHKPWDDHVTDAIAGAGLSMAVLAWALFTWPQMISAWRQDKADEAIRANTQKIDGLNTVAHLFDEPPTLRAVHGEPLAADASPATPGSTPGGQLVPFSRPEGSR